MPNHRLTVTPRYSCPLNRLFELIFTIRNETYLFRNYSFRIFGSRAAGTVAVGCGFTSGAVATTSRRPGFDSRRTTTVNQAIHPYRFDKLATTQLTVRLCCWELRLKIHAVVGWLVCVVCSLKAQLLQAGFQQLYVVFEIDIVC